MRLRRYRLLVLVGGLVASGCTGASLTPPLAGQPPRAAAQDLRLATGQDPFLRGDPPAPNIGLLPGGPNPAIFETLTRLSPSFGLAPGLALRWESPSPTRWRFVLRRGVTFHDGRPLDAAAVAVGLDAMAARQAPPRGLARGSAQAGGEDVVEVALSKPNLRLPEQLANPSFGIQAPGTQAGRGDGPGRTPTGTGPFRFDGYAPGFELRVRANDGYWGEHPSLRSITFRFGPDADASRLVATRQVDAAGLVTPGALSQVSGQRDRRMSSAPARASYLLLNVSGVERWATLKEEAVRRAVTMAVDRQAVTASGWPDGGRANPSLIPELVLGEAASRVQPPSHDAAAARALLDQAGWTVGPDGVQSRAGRRLVLSLVLSPSAAGDRAAGAIRSQLAEVGIGVEVIEPGPDPVAAAARVNQSAFDLFLDLRYQDDANPCALCRFFSIRPGGQLTVSGTVGAGPRADDLFDRAHQAPSVESVRRLAADLMQVVVAERVVALPLATVPTTWVLSPRVQGFAPSSLPGAQSWEQVWLST